VVGISVAAASAAARPDRHRRFDGAPGSPRDPVAYTEDLCRRHGIGTPDDAVTALVGSAARTGTRHVLLMVDGAGDRGRTCENIARIGAEVLPRLRAS
jgi:hypothetical protein